MDIKTARRPSWARRDDHKGSMAMRSTGRRRSLRILSPDFIGKATDETATQVTRIGLTFLSTTVFCLLSLLNPDSALLGGSERINVPFAGPVSFFGFMLLGPAVLIVLRIYLHIYVEHSERLERLARSMSIMRAPMLVPLQNPLIRYFSGLIFYLLLPLTMLFFAWKSRRIPGLGLGSAWRCGSGHRQPSHAAVQQDFLAIKGVAEPQRDDNCRRGSFCWVAFF
jgi:hypothetical protein